MNIPADIACQLRCGPRTQPAPDWEASRHVHEVRYWAQHLDYLEKLLPGLRRQRGDDMASRLMDEVVDEIRAAHGEKRAREALEWLRARWRSTDTAGGIKTGAGEGR